MDNRMGSIHIPYVKLEPSDVNVFGSDYNELFSKRTLTEHKRMSTNYQTQKLIKKIEEKGSLYGKSASEVSEKIAELRKHPEI